MSKETIACHISHDSTCLIIAESTAQMAVNWKELTNAVEEQSISLSNLNETVYKISKQYSDFSLLYFPPKAGKGVRARNRSAFRNKFHR